MISTQVQPDELTYPVTLILNDETRDEVRGVVSWVTAKEYAVLLDRADKAKAFTYSKKTRAPRKLGTWLMRIGKPIGLTMLDLSRMIPPEDGK